MTINGDIYSGADVPVPVKGYCSQGLVRPHRWGRPMQVTAQASAPQARGVGLYPWLHTRYQGGEGSKPLIFVYLHVVLSETSMKSDRNRTTESHPLELVSDHASCL
jgi:hypothetical protein